MQVTVQLRSRVLYKFKRLVGINFQGFFILWGICEGTNEIVYLIYCMLTISNFTFLLIIVKNCYNKDVIFSNSGENLTKGEGSSNFLIFSSNLFLSNLEIVVDPSKSFFCCDLNTSSVNIFSG